MIEQQRPSAIVKVGGSLLDWPELPERLREFLGSLGPMGERVVLLVGGGRTVDLIREIDSIHQLGEERSHRLAIQALDLTAFILGNILRESNVIADDKELSACWDAGLYPILMPSRLMAKDEDQFGDGLPSSWDVTSDSIAARLAGRLFVDRLVLLKSTELFDGTSRSDAATLGLVDPFFPTASRGLKQVDYRNLRNHQGSLIQLSDDE